MNRHKILFILSFVFLFYSGVTAQDECEQSLNKASEEFNLGHHIGVPDMLSSCMDHNQNREWRQRANLLLAETYLLLENDSASEESYLEVLRANPEYETDQQRDPVDLVYLSSRFTATPIFTLSGKIGPNVSIIRTLVERGTTTDESDRRYTLMPGLQAGVGLDYNYSQKISAMIEANFVFSAYKQKTEGFFGRDEKEVYDRQSWIRIPLGIKYSSIKGRYRPYGYAGFSMDILLGDRSTITYKDQNYNPASDRVESIDRESPILKIKSQRNTFNRSVFVGGGVKYKVKLNYIFLDLRYSFGLTNLVNPTNSIYDYNREGSDKTSSAFQESGDGAIRWTHIDDLFRMDNVFLSVGYVHPLYKPRKLKKGNTKSVLRQVKKQGDEVRVD
jgi:hypothetical protein